MPVFNFNLTKIIATLGPSSDSTERIRELIRAGADCFRLNFSHGDGASMQPLIERVREASRAESAHIPILADIQGPKLRIGTMPRGGVELIEGKPFVLTLREVEGSPEIAHSPYEYLARDLEPGARILLADGTIEMEVRKIDGVDVQCVIISGGKLTSNKGLNLPGRKLSVETLTAKDKRDLEYISGADVEMVAVSFVRSARDIVDTIRLLSREKMQVMAKLERPEALEHLDDILEVADGVMIARGDLGVEMDFAQVPTLQKMILARSAARGKWAVVATQMLGSMVNHRRPSRAEVSDVANAVADGADAVMLSEESAAGEFPVAAVEAMVRIAREAEHLPHTRSRFESDIATFAAGAAGAAVSAAERLNAKSIVTLAGSGLTALLVSKWRPSIPILALSGHEPTLRRLNVLRGVVPLAMAEKADMERQIEIADNFLLEEKWAKPGDTVVVVAAVPLGSGSETNTLRFHRIRSRDGGFVDG